MPSESLERISTTMNDFDPPSSPSDAGIQRALRVAWSEPSPDFARRAVNVTAAERQAAVDRVRDSSATGSGSGPRWAAAAVLVLGLGVLVFALDLFRGPNRAEEPRSSTDAGMEWTQDEELDDDKELKVWNPGDLERGLAVLESAHFETRPVYPVVGARRDGMTRSIADAEVRVVLDAAVRKELVAALLAADAIEADRHRFRGAARRVLDLRFAGGKWLRPLLYDAKKSGCLVLVAGSLHYRFRMPRSLVSVLRDAATKMSQRWLHVRRAEDLENAPRSLRAVVIDGVEIRSLAGLPLLRTVEIQGMLPTAALLRAVAETSSLRFLRISVPLQSGPPELDLSALARLERLASVSISNSRIDPQQIAALRGLRAVSFQECALKGPGLTLLSQLPLRALKLYDSDAPSVEELRSLRESVMLREFRTRVGSDEHLDALLESVRLMPRLKKLHFEYARNMKFKPRVLNLGRDCESLVVESCLARR